MKSTRLISFIAGVGMIAAAGCNPPPTDNSSQASPDAASSPAAASSPTAETLGPPTPPLTAGDAAAASTKMPDTTTIDGKTVKLTSTSSGLRYYDMKVGSGPNPKKGQTVSVQYTGTLLDGTKFDSSYDHGGTPIDFPIGVGGVIKGWDEGVPTMKVGGKRRLVVPAELAYGSNPPTPAIPPDSILVFDIELVGVK